nr:hypothetical protein [Tanacetum cinerariifolium]
PLRGGFYLFCDLKAKNSFTYDPNAYSFNETSSNFNLLPPQFETYLCKLCENNSHDGYDCQQQFSFVYEQEPSYNQNYNDNYYPHDSPSFLCCNNCGGSHATFQCQPMDQNTNSSGFDQFQPPQYSSKEISNDELKIMLQSYFVRMNQSREQEELLAEQELRQQEQAAQEKEGLPKLRHSSTY